MNSRPGNFFRRTDWSRTVRHRDDSVREHFGHGACFKKNVTFNITSRYLDDILNINTICIDSMVRKVYPPELQLNKTNTSNTEASFLDLHLFISNDIVSTKINDKRDV